MNNTDTDTDDGLNDIQLPIRETSILRKMRYALSVITIGELYAIFVRKRTLVEYQSQSEVIKYPTILEYYRMASKTYWIISRVVIRYHFTLELVSQL